MQKAILALETSTHACSVALQMPDHAYSEHVVEPQIHTKVILPMVDRVLQQAGIGLKELDLLAYGHGPGSFTGLRIAASVVQGLAFGANKSVVGISSIAALAQLGFAETGARHLLAQIDARMSEVYWGAYVVNDFGIVEVVGSDHLSTEIPASYDLDKYTLVGMGAAGITYPRALEIALLAQHADSSAIKAASAAIPSYIRKAV